MPNISFNSIMDGLVNPRNAMYKRASDGLDSSVPDDPTGDGTVDPDTGAFYDAMSDDLHDDPFVESNADTEGVENDSDPVADLTNIGTEIYSVDDPIQEDYNMDVPDPGTDTPVKTSAYRKYASCSFEQNQREFNRYSSILLQDMNERSGRIQKSASAYRYMPPENLAADRVRKLQLIANEASNDAALFAKNAAYVMRKAAEGEEISDSEAPVESLEDTLATPAEIAPEDAAALTDIPTEALETLIETPEPQLELLEQVAEAVDAGQLEPEQAVALITGDEAPLEGDTGSCEDGSCDTPKEAAYRRRLKAAAYQRLMWKIAEEAPMAESDPAVAAELAPEDLAAIEELPPETIEDLIAVEDAVQNGDIDPEVAMAVLDGDPEALEAVNAAAPEAVPEASPEEVPPSEAEATAAFSDALAEQGVSPDQLEAVADEQPAEKAASLRKIAACVRRHRSSRRRTRNKTARHAAIKSRCHQVLNEYTN